MIDGVLLDLSGVLYVGDAPLSGAREALRRLTRSALPVHCVTNTTRSPRVAIAAQLQRLGFGIELEQVYTAPMAARDYLLAHQLRPHLLVHPDLRPEFADLPSEPPNAVLLGDAGSAFTYAQLNEAFRLLMGGATLVAMGRNRYFKEADGLSLDAGPFVAALEYAAGTRAVVTGKPSAEFFHAACAALGTDPAHTLMVGDDVEADVNGAVRAGLQGALVRSGKYRPGDEAQLQDAGACVFADLAAVTDWLLQARA